MAIDKLALYNGALRLCGEERTTLTEDREVRYILDTIWDEGAVKYALEQGQWSFATRTARLEASTTISPEFGYQYAFEKPSDYIRTVGVSIDEYFYNVLTKFADEQNYLFLDVDEVYFRFISEDENYGGNMAGWSMSFAKYFMAYMAYEAAPRITGVKTDMEKLERTMNKRLLEAQNQDGINRPTKFPSAGSWNEARNANYIGNGRAERWR